MVGLQNQWMESLYEVKHAAATQIVSERNPRIILLHLNHHKRLLRSPGR